MPSWADDVPEPAAQQSGSRRGPAAAEGGAPRRSVLDRLGPAAALASSPGVPPSRPAPRPQPQPQPREGKGQRGNLGSGTPDLGPEVDWRLSRISLDDDDGPRRRARGLPEARGRRVVTVTPEGAAPDLAVPARLAGRIVLPSSAQPQVASPPSRRKSPPPPREAAATAQPAKSGAPAPPLVVHVGPRGDRVVQRAAASPPVPKPAAPKPAPKAAALPRPELWHFRDKRGTVQGPHSAGELVAWYAAGYYGADLPVQRVGEAWTTLREALPELKQASVASAAQTKAVHAVPAVSAAAKPAAAAPPPRASVWSTEETLAAKRMFDKLGTLWMYIDTSGERQGPFGGHDMATWFMGGYMEDRELMVANATTREPGGAEFSPLAALLKSAS